MKSTPACLCLLVLAGGCARSTLAVLVPELHLGLSARRFSDEVALVEPRTQGLHATVSASLRWQSRIEASDVPATYELDPQSWLAPCADGDLECLREAAESEAEFSAVFRDEP